MVGRRVADARAFLARTIFAVAQRQRRRGNRLAVALAPARHDVTVIIVAEVTLIPARLHARVLSLLHHISKEGGAIAVVTLASTPHRHR